MPSKAKKICAHPGCKELVENKYCEAHRPEPKKVDWRKKRGTRSENKYRDWYSTDVWRRLRASHLASEPLCRECAKADIITPATVVDHIIPHCGDWEGFTDPDNLQSLCVSCHNRKTAREDGAFGNRRKYKG